MQLHSYVWSQSITPHLDNSYSALAVNNETYDSFVFGNVPVANIILACPIAVTVLVFIVITMLLVIYTTRDQWKRKPPLTVGAKATMLSLAVTNSSYSMFVIVLDYNAIVAGRNQLHSIHGQGGTGTPYNVLYNIPVAVLVIDVVATLPSYFLASQVYDYMFKRNISDIKDNQYYRLVLSTIGVFISLLNHAPYMLMAYFVDAYYTSGVLIFYIFMVLLWFSLQEFIFDSWLRKTDKDNLQLKCLKCSKHTCACSVLFFGLTLLYLGLGYTIILFLLEIPIKPVFIAIGSFAMYKIIYNRKRVWTCKDDAQKVRQSEETQNILHEVDEESLIQIT